MKTSLLLIPLIATASFAFASTDSACCCCCASQPATTTLAASTTDSKATYPLDTCVVSGEKLGEMGKPVDYIHKEEGKPDRLVRLCCKMCIPKFKKDPAKYLKILDEAAARKKA